MFHVSSSWRNGLRKSSSSAAGGSDEENEDFSVSFDSEEEQQREMEEFLYCQMYIEAGSVKSVKNSEEESDYHVSDVSYCNIPLTLHSKENGINAVAEEMKQVKRQRYEDFTDVAKSCKKLRKSNMIADTSAILDDTLLPKKSSEEETVSISESKISDESFHSSEVGLLQTDSEKSMMSDIQPCVVEDESEHDEKVQKQQPEKNKRSQKMREKEVIDVSVASSDSSLFLDISSEDDIDVHMVKSHATSNQSEDDENLQAVLSSLPECDWKINNTDRFGASFGKKSRYYDSTLKFQCSNCNQRGHFTHACPEPKKEKACILCGNRGHWSRYCCYSLCYRCNRPGHAAKECDRKRIWHKDACCRCGIQGHFKNECPDNWRQYHLTTGSNELVNAPKMENHRKFCYNCAASGHFGHECRRRRQDNYMQPLVPFIIKYDRNLGKRSQAKDPILQNESLPLYVAGNKSYSVQHCESWRQKDGVQHLNGKLLNQRGTQSERNTLKQGDDANRNPVEYDKIIETGKGNSSQWTNFARTIKDRLFDMKLKSAKNSHKKPKKAKGLIQVDYFPLNFTVFESEANIYPYCQRSFDIGSEAKSPSSIVSSLSKSVICHTPNDGLCVGDFQPSKEKAWKNQYSLEFSRKREDSRLSNYSGSRSGDYYSKKLLSATPKELETVSNTFICSRISEWQQTSTRESNVVSGHRQKSHEFLTPEGNLTGHKRRNRGFFAGDVQKFEGDQMLEEYYGKKQIRNARRKERKKKKREMLALDKANLSLKSAICRSDKKRGSTNQVIKTERISDKSVVRIDCKNRYGQFQ